MTPRFMVTSVALLSPVIFRTLFSFSFPLRYSATVTSMPILLISWKPASGPSVTLSPRFTRKLNCTYGRSRSTAMAGCSFPACPSQLSRDGLLIAGSPSAGRASYSAVRGPLADAEDDELGGPQRRDADQADKPAVVQVVLGHRRAVAFNEVRLFRLIAQQRAHLELVEQEVLDRAPDVGPERLTVGFEDRPLGSAVDGVLEVGEVAAEIDALPLPVRADRPGPP